MGDICEIIPIIPQSHNMGTCWFNAILTCCLYSDGLSAIIFQKAIEDRWWESGSVIKIYMYNVLSYLYAIKNGRTDLIKSLERYLNTYRPELLLLSYINEYDIDLFQQKNLILTGYHVDYFEFFLNNIGIETGDNVKIIKYYDNRILNVTDCIIITTLDYYHAISLLTCNNIGYVYDGDNKKCKLMMFDWKIITKRFRINYDTCEIIVNPEQYRSNDMLFFTQGHAVLILDIPKITRNFQGIKFTELRMTDLLKKNINFDDIDDITKLKHISQILGLEYDDDDMNIDKLKEDIKKEYNKLLEDGFFKSITLGSKDELSIELKDVLDEELNLSLISVEKKRNMIKLTIDNLLKITENDSYKRSLNNILSGLKNKNETKLNDRYLYLRRFKKQFIGIFKEDSEYFSDVIKHLLEISVRNQERIDELINEFIKNFIDMDYKDDKLRLEELKRIDDKSITDKKEYLFILFKLLKKFAIKLRFNKDITDIININMKDFKDKSFEYFDDKIKDFDNFEEKIKELFSYSFIDLIDNLPKEHKEQLEKLIKELLKIEDVEPISSSVKRIINKEVKPTNVLGYKNNINRLMENIKMNYKNYKYIDYKEQISFYQEINKLEKIIKDKLSNLNIEQLETIYDLMKVERTKENLLEIIKSVNDKFSEWDTNPPRSRLSVRYLS